MPIPRLKHFSFWCQSVLPLVYDDSLSYYEVLCKVVTYINNLIDSDRQIIGEVDELRQELKVVQDWIDNYNTQYAEEIISDYIASMIFVEINDEGYIVYNIPQSWKEIEFNTTEYDIILEQMPEYGHLVLSY